jgi:hypothetical protein
VACDIADFNHKTGLEVGSAGDPGPFGHVLLNNSANGWWRFGIGENTASRLGGQASKFVFRFNYSPSRAAMDTKSFRLLI